MPHVSKGPKSSSRSFAEVEDEVTLFDLAAHLSRRLSRKLTKKISKDKGSDDLGNFLLFVIFIWSLVILSLLFR